MGELSILKYCTTCTLQCACLTCRRTLSYSVLVSNELLIFVVDIHLWTQMTIREATSPSYPKMSVLLKPYLFCETVLTCTCCANKTSFCYFSSHGDFVLHFSLKKIILKCASKIWHKFTFVWIIWFAVLSQRHKKLHFFIFKEINVRLLRRAKLDTMVLASCQPWSKQIIIFYQYFSVLIADTMRQGNILFAIRSPSMLPVIFPISQRSVIVMFKYLI